MSSPDHLPALVRRVRVLARLADAWLAPRSPWMARARREIPKVAPFSPTMIEASLRTVFAGWTLATVARWAHDDLPPRLRRRAAARCARGDRAGEALLVLPSTVFAAAWQSSAAAWLAGWVPVFRPSRREPVFARLLSESARAVGGRDLPSRVLRPGSPVGGEREYRAVVAYGSDETVALLRARLGRRVFGFGAQVGAAWVSRRALSDRRAAALARGLARDVALYETQGCLSPACVFVDSRGKVSPPSFSVLLAKELDLLDRTLPARGGEAMEQESFLHLWRFRASQGRATLLGRHVVLHGERAFAPTGLRRMVFVRPVSGAAEVARLCAGWPVPLACLGVGGEGDLAAVRRVFRGRPGLLVTEIGRMHEPPPSWRNGGRSLLAGLAAG